MPSFAVSVTVTGAVVFQPAPFGAGAADALTTGAVRSTRIVAEACEGTGALPIAQTVCGPSATAGIASDVMAAVPAGPAAEGEPASGVAASSR